MLIWCFSHVRASCSLEARMMSWAWRTGGRGTILSSSSHPCWQTQRTGDRANYLQLNMVCKRMATWMTTPDPGVFCLFIVLRVSRTRKHFFPEILWVWSVFFLGHVLKHFSSTTQLFGGKCLAWTDPESLDNATKWGRFWVSLLSPKKLAFVPPLLLWIHAVCLQVTK